LHIHITGARENNLKNLSLSLPRNQLIVFTGVSGSGKSSLAFDTIFAEAQNEFVESLSSFARKYLEKSRRPDVDQIVGLSPALLINQRPLGRSPRSTVGTVTELYTLLRLLFSRVGTPRLSAGEFSFNTPSGSCPRCKGLGNELTVDVDALIDWDLTLADGAIRHRSTKVGSRYWNIIAATKYFDMHKPLRDFTQEELDLLLYSPPIVYKNEEPGFVQRFSYEGIASRLFRRQADDRGLDIREEDAMYLTSSVCSVCHGARLNANALAVRIAGHSIVEYSTIPLSKLADQLHTIEDPAAVPIIAAMTRSLTALLELGVDYLSLNRSVDTLSGGEAQRIKLARQLGSSLTELIYVLDEPTAGLHAREVEHLVDILIQIRSKPNTVIVVEHDEVVYRNADYLVELGPGAGKSGGTIVAQGTPEEIIKNRESITGAYLSGKLAIPVKAQRRQARGHIVLRHVKRNNLKNLDVDIPTGILVCLSGVSGSGKSSLVDELVRLHPEIIIVDQSPVGKSSRSIPVTYVGVFDLIRQEFAQAVGQDPSLFTFNGSGACPTCHGLGFEEVDMHFLEDIRLICEDCKGQRYNPKALAYRYQNRTIAEILDMTVTEAIPFFSNPKIKAQLGALDEVGLGYLQMGQPLDTLSGGESQRVKLCSYLTKRGNFYVLDEPTRGLHAADVQRLLGMLDRLVATGNSVLIVEHNLDMIRNADWLIDLGPEGGELGGEVVAVGTPEHIAQVPTSYTGRYLKEKLPAAAHQVG